MRAREAVDHYIGICLVPFSLLPARNWCAALAAVWGADWMLVGVDAGDCEHARRDNAREFLIGPSNSCACIPTCLSGLRMTALRCRNLLAEYERKAMGVKRKPEICAARPEQHAPAIW